mgnify:CR=1 FL=1
MKELEKSILYLFLHHQTVSHTAACFSHGISMVQFLEILENLNRQMEGFASINAYDDKMFVLKIFDEEKLREFKKSIFTFYQDDQKDRVRIIITVLLGSDDYIKIDDLADEMYISRRQISKDLALVRRRFQEYGLEIVSVPYYGLKAEGLEMSKRLLLAHSLINETKRIIDTDMIQNKEVYRKIRLILLQVLRQDEISMDDYSLNNLQNHLYIALIRIKSGCVISESIGYALDPRARKAAEEILRNLSDSIDLDFNENEITYLGIQLESKSLSFLSSEEKKPEIIRAVMDFLKEVDRKNHTCYEEKEELISKLYQHFYMLNFRLKYHFQQVNYMLNSIKQKYLYEYTLVLDSIDSLQKSLNGHLSEDEIGYIALLLAMYPSQMNRSYRLLLTRNAGNIESEYVALQIREILKDIHYTLEVKDHWDLDEMDLSQYDCILSTLPLYVKTECPVIRFDFADINEEEKHKIRGFFEKDKENLRLREIFPARLFFKETDYQIKEVAIKELVERAEKEVELPENFLEQIWNYDREYNCILHGQIAFLHPIEINEEKSWVGVAVNKKRVKWDDERSARILMIGNIGREQAAVLLHAVSALSDDEEKIRELLHRPEYRNFCELTFR